MRGRIFFKLLAAFVAVIVVATLALDLSVRKAWEESLFTEIHTGMVQKVHALADKVENERGRPIEEIARSYSDAVDARVTIINSAGLVLADTRANPAEMENHATRPEFIAALQHGQVGSSTRMSHTVGIPFHYVAAPVKGGAVRLAYPLGSIQEMTRSVRLHLLVASGISLVLATILAALIAQLISRRLRRIVDFAQHVASGDLAARLDERSSDEIGQVAAALDRTAHKLEESFAALDTSRRQLETVLNSMQDPVFVVSREKRVQWANAPVMRVTRMAAGTQLIDAFRDPSLLQAVEASLEADAMQHARAVLAGRNYDVFVGPMPGGGAVVVLHDVSEVERLEKTRRDFIANVSHELRTPLTSIQGYTETLLDTEDRHTSREFLEIVRKNATRMARLTEDLLVLARVESGEQRFSIRAVNVSELLGDAAETFRTTAGTSGVMLKVSPGFDVGVMADPDAIHQVFSNLIDNAVKYAGSGGEIEVGTREHEDGVEFYVRDFGPGIASEHLPRLFERFYRVDKARSREAGGTGLGLAIVKHIIRAHGGSIHARSELGHGATFSFVLPLAPTPVVEQSDRSAAL